MTHRSCDIHQLNRDVLPMYFPRSMNTWDGLFWAAIPLFKRTFPSHAPDQLCLFLKGVIGSKPKCLVFHSPTATSDE